jgi:hypothetical protein
VVNLLEFATGTDPNLKFASAWQLLNDAAETVFSYTRPSAAQDALRYSVEWSTALSGVWQTTEPGTVTNDDGTLQTVRTAMPVGAVEGIFVRPRVRKLL